jgi:predicted RNase H-like HicB family nuclease
MDYKAGSDMARGIWALIHEDRARNGKKVFGISFPDFPGVASAGASVDDAIERGRATLAFHVEGLMEDGMPIPQRSTLEAIRSDPEWQTEIRDINHVALVKIPFDLPGKTVRINLSIDENLLSAIDRAAEAVGQTRSGFLAESAKARLRTAA